jgi:hypothetical protein
MTGTESFFTWYGIMVVIVLVALGVMLMKTRHH